MTRDITMIVAVLVAVVSLSYGVYKNVEADLLEDHASAQVYRALGAVQEANLSTAMKNDIIFDALGRIEPAPQVVDFSRSSADEAPQGQSICPPERLAHCNTTGAAQAEANAACARDGARSDACKAADQLSIEILESACIECYRY